MNENDLQSLLQQVRDRNCSVEEALDRLASMPYQNLEHSRIDHHRTLRCGFPEVIFCEGKDPEEIKEITVELLESEQPLLATRVSEDARDTMFEVTEKATYHERARCVTVEEDQSEPIDGTVGIISAGTSDAHAAEEARVTCETFGARVQTAYDAGVAGLHRLLNENDLFEQSDLFIVVAGMEGALPSVIGGMVNRPVIGVPTSTGYGTAFQGVTALLGMLNSCTPAVVPVNIDNGFGAAYFSCLILKMHDEKREKEG